MNNIPFKIFTLFNLDIFPKELIHIIANYCFDLIPININLKDQTVLQIGDSFYSNIKSEEFCKLKNYENKSCISNIQTYNGKIYFVDSSTLQLLKCERNQINLVDDDIRFFNSGSCGYSQDQKLGAMGVIDVKGVLYMKGHNSFGRVKFHHSNNGRYTGFVNTEMSKMKFINCEWDHCVAISECGDLYTWGADDYRQLGLGENIKYDNDYGMRPFKFSPQKIGKGFAFASSGKTFTMALNKNGELFSCGNGYAGQLGYNLMQSSVLKKIEIDEPISIVSCGCDHTMALSTNGNLYGWGLNDEGQLGLEHTEQIYTPIKIAENVKMIQCGYHNTMFVKNNNDIYVCGYNLENSLLISDKKFIRIPTKLNLEKN